MTVNILVINNLILKTRRLTFWTRNHPKCRVSMTEESKERHEKLQQKNSKNENETEIETEPNCLTKCFNSKNINEPEYKG